MSTRTVRKPKKKTKPDKRVKWNPKLLITVYEYAKSGYPNAKIAQGIGVQPTTFDRWLKERGSLRDALSRGRGGKEKGGQTIIEYIYGRLSNEAKRVWDNLQDCMANEDHGASTAERVDAVFADKGMKMRKLMFLHALVQHNYNISEACRMVNTSITIINRWKADPQFCRLFDEMTFHQKNFIEGALMKKVAEGDTTAVIFAAKAKLAERGYTDKKVIEGKIDHNHNHQHTMINIDELPLSIACKREILTAIRNQQHQQEMLTLEAESREVGEVVDDDDFE